MGRPALTDFGVLVVSFRSRADLPEVLAPFRGRYPIVVVDNASDDGTDAWLRAQSDVESVLLPANLGFAAAVNLGIDRLKRWPYALVVNPDARIDEASAQRLARFLDTHSDVAAVGPRITRPEGEEPSLLMRPTPWRTALFLLSGMRWYGIGGMSGAPASGFPWRKARCGDHLRGSCLMIRMRAWEDVGPMDERFFLYFEETDWCLRARARGWRICIEPDAHAFH
ncbi:MAG: glycosyltransferase family 2 protein, partial [Zetaproteobacteria bacterium]